MGVARDAKQLMASGKSLYDTRLEVDRRWNTTGFPTDTPMPPS